jgi:serine protease
MAGFQSYRDSAGTSFSTPVVAGLVALLLESNPNLDVDAVRNILTSNALRDSAVGNVPNNLYGWGKAFLPPDAVPGGSSPGGSGGGFSGGGSSGGGGSAGGGGGGCTSASPDLYTALLALVLTAVLRKRIRRVL